jgi:hypothetical protein
MRSVAANDTSKCEQTHRNNCNYTGLTFERIAAGESFDITLRGERIAAKD